MGAMSSYLAMDFYFAELLLVRPSQYEMAGLPKWTPLAKFSKFPRIFGFWRIKKPADVSIWRAWGKC